MLLQSVTWTNLGTSRGARTGQGYCTQGTVVNASGTCLLAVYSLPN
jgi:hypothetical protein